MVSSYGLLSSSRPCRVVYSPEYHDVQPSDIFEEAHHSSPLLTESDDQTEDGHAMMKSDTLHFYQNLSQRERWCICHECRRHE